jgi:hypothetical protein
MTYNERIEELNKQRNKLDGLDGSEADSEPLTYIDAKIDVLEELRSEAISKVRELKKQNDGLYELFGKWTTEETKQYKDNMAIIDYLKAEWNITESDLKGD